MNDKLKREAAEQQAEARAGVKDALASGASFRQVMQEAAGGAGLCARR